MARGKGELVGFQLSFLARVVVGEKVAPGRLNPFRPPDPGQLAAEKEAGWDAWRAILTAKHKGPVPETPTDGTERG